MWRAAVYGFDPDHARSSREASPDRSILRSADADEQEGGLAGRAPVRRF
jgi:hypothetical protein